MTNPLADDVLARVARLEQLSGMTSKEIDDLLAKHNLDILLVNFAINNSRPVGEVTLWFGPKANIPNGWLALDGSSFSSVTYPELATLLGTTTLPNMADRSPVGVSGTKLLGATGGSATTTLVAANLPPHAHTIDHSHASRSSATAGGSTLAFTRSANSSVLSGGGMVETHSGNSGNGPGTSTAINVQDPYLAFHFIIRAA